ncbi:hypothetical protein D5086_020690 [Populus alba]|uniref:Uncharacterized protein n=1 Tax=Populus alba TaxID=43335 RepID=A0ACC4BMF6_POPAL
MEMAIQEDVTELNYGRSTEQIAHEEQLQQWLPGAADRTSSLQAATGIAPGRPLLVLRYTKSSAVKAYCREHELFAGVVRRAH